MKMRPYQLIGLCLLTASLNVRADHLSAKDYADKLFQKWTEPEAWVGFNAGARYEEYIKVPESLRSEVADRLFDKACSTEPKECVVIERLLIYVRTDKSVAISERFDAHLSKLARDPNWLIRKDVLKFLSELKRDKDHDLIRAALNDPNDKVREAALGATYGWPDNKAIIQKYIQDHESDPACKESVEGAKNTLNPPWLNDPAYKKSVEAAKRAPEQKAAGH
jgi:hypothetical protein